MNRMARLRVAVSRIDARELRATINALNRQDLGGLHPAERSALRALRSSRNPAQAILQPHYGPALQPVAEVLSHDCLEATRQALGDHADEPTLDQLQAALHQVRERFEPAMVALMLACTAASDAPAADICDHLLGQEGELGLQDVDEPAAAGPGPGTPGPVEGPAGPVEGPAGRGERPARPPKPKVQKASKGPHKPWKVAKDVGRKEQERPSGTDETRPARRSVSWRAPHLPASYAGAFDADDPLSGAVVIAEVAFDADDPAEQGSPPPPAGAKSRPCVVVAGSERSLLVRAGYTGRFQAESWRSTELVHWRQAGLKRPTHIEAEFRQIAREDIEVIGRLVEEDWNALW